MRTGPPRAVAGGHFSRTIKPVDARVFAMADRLLADFDHLPVGTVLRAIAGAHTTLRERGVTSEPDKIEELVRRVLRAAYPAQPQIALNPSAA
jgi:hypothetical protein